MKFEVKKMWGSSPFIICEDKEFHINRTLKDAERFRTFLRSLGADVHIKHHYRGLQMLEAFDIIINGQKFYPRSQLQEMVDALNSMGA